MKEEEKVIEFKLQYNKGGVALRLSLLSRLQTRLRGKSLSKERGRRLQLYSVAWHLRQQCLEFGCHGLLCTPKWLLYLQNIAKRAISLISEHPVGTNPMHLEDRHGAPPLPISPPPSLPNKLTKEGQKGYRSRHSLPPSLPPSLPLLAAEVIRHERAIAKREKGRKATQVSPIVRRASQSAIF